MHRIPQSPTLSRSLLCSVVWLWLAATISAQSVISVAVSSADSAQFLQRARIELQPTGRETFTDQFGVGEFTGVAAGEYTARVSYLGFPDAEVPVRVGAS